MSIAREIDRTVLLVDADIAKSDVTKTFGFSGKPGLTEYLNGEAEFRDIIHHTDLEGLAVLPTGKKVSNSTELLSSYRMIELMKQLSNYSKDRIVVIDSPPLLVTSEAQVLASMVGQVAFVVKANETKEKEFISAIERLDHSKYVGLVLNQSSEEAENGYYGYYHQS
jgi:capsular exopolysaccharide synthesis family protein